MIPIAGLLFAMRPLTLPVCWQRGGNGKSPLNGVYIFDEPEAALSPQRQLTLLINIYRCAQEGAQFIIVSHSPILLGMPDAEIFSFDNGTIHPCQYEDTDSYVITKTFVNNRQHFLNQLLNEET